MKRIRNTVLISVMVCSILFASAGIVTHTAQAAVKKKPVKLAAKPAANTAAAPGSMLAQYPVVDEINALKLEISALKKEIATLKAQSAASTPAGSSESSSTFAASSTGTLTVGVDEVGTYRMILTEGGPLLVGIDSISTTADGRYRVTLKIGNMSLAACHNLILAVTRANYDQSGFSNDVRVNETIDPGTWKSVELTTPSDFQTLRITLKASALSLVTP
ncbi:MAG: hypothetical protein ACM3QZ_06025 [Solirubrobacterales bacterium]